MASAAGISGVAGIAALQLQTEFAAKSAKLQVDNVSYQGDLAVQLIQAVAGVGENLDLRA